MPMEPATTTLPPYRNPGGIVPDRRNWRAFFACCRRVGNTSTGYGKMYEAFVAVSTPAAARLFYKVRAHPNGRKLFEDQPDLMPILNDDSYLASLPIGSVGHAYRSYMRANNLFPGVYDEATIFRPIAQRSNWSDSFYWLMRRCTTLHDFIHVVCGYPTDIAGEVLNIGFQSGQLEPAGPVKKIGLLLAVIAPGASVRHKVRAYRQSIERGQRADMLAAAPWEQLLDKPLDEVRELLGITPKAEAHPHGIWRAESWFFGFTPPTHWDYDEILAGERCG